MSLRIQLLVAMIAIWLATAVAFSNSFTIAFQFDDLHTVQSNVFVRSLSYVPRYFVDATTYSYRPENSGYRPMSTLACALGFQLSRADTWGYHLIKLVEHCLIATLILFLGLRLLPTQGSVIRVLDGRVLAAFFGALIFAVHRANTETVDYITAISTMQAGLFDLLAFFLYLCSRDVAGRRRYAYFGFSVCCYLLAMLSKEEGITLPAMILLYELIYGCPDGKTYLQHLRANIRTWAVRISPYVAMAALYLVLRSTFQPAIADTSRGNTPVFVYFITQFRSWLHYWGLFFWPLELNADNLGFGFSKGLDDLRVWGALAVHVAIWGAAIRFGRRQPFVLFATAWIYVTVLPASSIFPLVEPVNEHRMYIPYMFLAPLSAWLVFAGLTRLGERWFGSAAVGKNAAILVALIAALALGAGAHARNEVWQTELSLWEDVYAKSPDSPRAMNVLGISLINRGEFDRSVKLLERCRAVAPNYLPCMVHLSMAYAHLRRYDEGLKTLKYGNSLDPNYPHINFHLGLYYKDYLGQPELSMQHLERVRQVTGGRFFQATLKLAEIYIDKRDYPQAMRLADSVLQLDNSNGDAWDVLGRIEMLNGRVEKAERIFERLAQSAPDSIKYLFEYAHVAELKRDFQLSASLYSRIVTLSPYWIQAWQGLVRVTQQLGDLPGLRHAQGMADDLKRSGRWAFLTSLNLPGEKPGQIAP